MFSSEATILAAASFSTKNETLMTQSSALKHNLENLYALVSEATVQGCQIQDSIAQTAAIAFISIALPLSTGKNEAVKVVQEAVSGDVDILNSNAVQIAEIMLWRVRERLTYIKTRLIIGFLKERISAYSFSKVRIEFENVVELVL